jgi:large subunit ribosomal protein L25
VYGHGEEPLAVTLSEHEVELALLHGERLLEVDVDGKKHNVLIKEVQYDTFGHEVLHVDLSRVALDERVEVTVPIVLRGTPAGVAEGGVLHQAGTQADIECLVTAIPEEIRVPVAAMNIGDAFYMRDLDLPEGAHLLSEPDALVCSVTVVAEEEELPAEEEAPAAEPQVVGEEAEAEEGEPPAAKE